MRDRAPGLFARLHADHKGARFTGMGRDITASYDDILNHSVARHDYSPPNKVAGDMLRLTRTLLANAHLVDALGTYEAEHGRLLRQRHGDEAGGDLAEFEKEEYVLRMMHGCRQRLHQRSSHVEIACRRVLHHSDPPSDSLAVYLNEFDTALRDVVESFWQNHQMLTAIRNNDEMRFTDPTRARNDSETRAFMFDVIYDSRQIAEHIQRILEQMERNDGNERNDAEGPQPIAKSVQRIAQGLGLGTPAQAKAPLPERGRGPRGQYDEERVQEAISGHEAVNIFSARDTDSYRKRTQGKNGPDNQRG